MKKHPKYDKYLISEDGKVFSLHVGQYKTLRINTCGYVITALRIGKKDYSKRVHRLVAETYIPNPENKPEVNHKDGNKLNNHYTNLEWCSSKGNKEHALIAGLYDNIIGEKHVFSVISDEQAHKICEMLVDGMRSKDIAEYFGLEKDTVANIKAGRSYRHISKLYTFNIVRKKRKSLKTIRKVAQMLSDGREMDDIVLECNISRTEVNRIRRRVIYKDILTDYNF